MFRVTVEDLDTGDRQAMEVHEGDYVLIPFAPCRLHHTQASLGNGTVVLTIHGHRPQGKPREVPAETTYISMTGGHCCASPKGDEQ